MVAASPDDPFARLESQFETLRAKVRQAQQLASLGAVAPLIAHEVSNLFTPIVNYAQTALAGDDVELMKKALRITVQNAAIAVAMSNRLLNLAGAKPPERKAVNVRTIVEDAYASLCRDLTRDGIQVRFEVDPDLSVIADPLQLQQVLFNLLLNAHEAMKGSHNGRLVVTARREGAVGASAGRENVQCKGVAGAAPSRDRVVIELRNTGKPIPPELLPHIFDALESSKTASANGTYRCSGLGLALCRDLVEENGGTISVASDADNDTRFTLRLPAQTP